MPVKNLALNRRLTKAFIDANPEVVVLTPQTRVKKPAGGWAYEDQPPRDPQTMTIIEQTGLSGQPRLLPTMDGTERQVEFTLLGEWNAVMARGDHFWLQGKEWEIVDLFFDNEYEARALVTARG